MTRNIRNQKTYFLFIFGFSFYPNVFTELKTVSRLPLALFVRRPFIQKRCIMYRSTFRFLYFKSIQSDVPTKMVR